MDDISDILELVRLEELNKYDILGTPEETFYDDLTQLLADVCGTSMAFISFLDENDIWLKAKIGLTADRIPRHLSMCQYAVKQSEITIINDLAKDTRFKNSPFVSGEPFIRFYAGVPLINENGFVLGTYCALDVVPRELSDAQIRSFLSLQRILMRELEKRRGNQERFSLIQYVWDQKA